MTRPAEEARPSRRRRSTAARSQTIPPSGRPVPVPGSGPGSTPGTGPASHGRATDGAAIGAGADGAGGDWVNRRPGTGPRHITQTVLVALACLPAALIPVRLFDEARAVSPLAGAIAVAALLGWLAARRLASVELVWAVGLVGGVLYGLATTAGDVGVLVQGLRAGWPRLLAAAVPAQPRAQLLVPLAALLWVAAYLAVVLVARTENALVPVVPPLAALIGVLMIVGAAGGRADGSPLGVGGWRPSPVALTGLYVLLAMSVAALRAARLPAAAPGAPAEPAGPRPTQPADVAGSAGAPVAAGAPARPGRPGRRGWLGWRPVSGTLAVGLVIVVAVALLATTIGGTLPVASRFDVRAHVEPPLENVVTINPLVQVRAQLAEPASRDLFTVRLTSATGTVPAVDPRTGKPAALDTRVRIAALGDFTGASWRDDGRFVRVDRTLPTPDGSAAAGSAAVTVRADVTLGTLDSDLLPTLGQAASVDYRRAAGGPGGAAGLAFQASSGSLAALSIPATGDRVQLVARVPRPGKEQLAAATPATGPEAAAYTALPKQPTWAEQTARRLVGDARTPYQQLVALERALASSRYPYDLSAPPGHSYGVLYDFLTSRREQDAHGYAEQHAAAFAVLARALGFPARIAVGYLLDTNHESADGTFTVTNWQAHAWPEVLLDGLGWVPFEPTDTTDLRRSVPPQTATPAGGTSVQMPPSSKPIEPPALDPALGQAGDAADAGGHGALWWTLVAILLALPALALLTLSLIVGEKARRRLARRRGTPADRVRGAWREARDRLAEYGVSRSHALTHREVVQIVEGTSATAVASGALHGLLTLAETARFAGDHVTGPDAARAWRLVDEIGRDLRRHGGLVHAARARIDPRPLLPASRAPAAFPVVAPEPEPTAGRPMAAVAAVTTAVPTARQPAAGSRPSHRNATRPMRPR